MFIEQLLAFNLALFMAIASPGPALLVAIQTTVSAGRRSGVAIGCGLALMAAMWTLMALLGLEVVFTIFPWAYAAMKTLGAIYLIYIAWNMWQGARDEIQTTAKPTRKSFKQGILINALNPKSVLFAAAVLVVIFPASMSWTDNVIVVVNHLVIELVFYIALAFGMSTAAVRKTYLKMKAYIDRFASVVLGGLGVRLLSDR